MRIVLSTLALLTASPAWAEPPQVVVDTPVTASLVSMVMGDLGQAQILLPQGASAHHHQMRPSDAQGLQRADLLIWTGPELTPWLDRAAGSVAGNAAQLRLLDVPGTHLRGYGVKGEGRHSHDDHAQEARHDHGHAHQDGSVDPHAWLDPGNAPVWLEAIAATLANADPGNADTYGANAAAAAARLRDVEADLQQRLAPHRDATFVVFHDAYGYFTDHFGLKPALAISLGDASTPSAARLAEIRSQIAATDARCAFPEYGSDAMLVQTVVEGMPVRIGAELAPEGSSKDAGADLYVALLTGLTNALDDCLSQE